MYQDVPCLGLLHTSTYKWYECIFENELPTDLKPKLFFTRQVADRIVKVDDLHFKRNFSFHGVVRWEGNGKKISHVAEILRKKTKGESLDKALDLITTAYKEYSNKQYESAKKNLQDVLAMLGHRDKISERTDSYVAKQHVLIIARNNYACILFKEGEIEKSLSIFHSLVKEVIEELGANEERERNIPRNPSSKDLSVRRPLLNESEMSYFLVLIINYSNASLCGQNYGEIVPFLEDVVQSNPRWFNENPMMKRFVVVILAQILVIDGKRKQAFVLFDLQGIDGLIIQKDIDESPLAIFYIREACHILAQRGERDQAKHLHEIALKSCKEMYQDSSLLDEEFSEQRKRNPPALICIAGSMVKLSLKKEFRLLVRCEKDSDAKEEVLKQVGCPQTLSRTASPSSHCTALQVSIGPRYANLAFQKTLCSRREGHLLLVDVHSEYMVLQGSQVKGLGNLRIVFPRPQKLFPDTRSVTVVTKAEDILSKVHPLLTKKAWLSRSHVDKEHIIASLFLLLEELLALKTRSTNLYKCICLLCNLAKEKSEENDEVELYKDCLGKLSYFIRFDKLRMLDGEIPLNIVVLCGEKNQEEDVILERKPLFRKISSKGQCKFQEGDANRPSSFGAMVFLRSFNLLDINCLRQVTDSIVQSVKTLENPSINVHGQGSVLIEVVSEINPEKLPQQSLQLRLIAPFLIERDEPVFHGPIQESSVQNLFLQQFQKRLTLKNELDLDVFTSLFQYRIFNLRIVDVQYKARKKMVCLMKGPPYSVLTLHTKENTLYLTIQDVVNRFYSDGIPAHGAILLIDDTVAECYERLGISRTNDPKECWKRLSDEEIDDSLIFNIVEEDFLKKAFKTNDRLTEELEYLKEKNQNLTARARKLLDQLSVLERRASLLQDHFVQTTTLDSDRTKAAEEWFAEKRRQEDPLEGPSDDEDLELEELLESLSIDELAEFLAEIKRPDLMSKDETRDQTRKVYCHQDFEKTGYLCDKKTIILQETSEGAFGESFDQNVLKACVEGKDSPKDKSRLHHEEVIFDEEVETGASNLSSSDGKRIGQEDMEGVGGKSSSQPSWLLPSPEGTPVSSSSDIAGEEAQPPVLIEGYTQTDSLGFIQEYKDVIVQTDPIHLDEEETLEKGSAEFKRDRAERQLRKSRLSQDVHVFKTRPRQTTPGSHESIASFSSGETPRNSIFSGSLQEPKPSKVSSNETESEHSEESSQYSILTKTSGFCSEGTAPTDSSSSQSSISSYASSHVTEAVLSEETPRDSITSESFEQLHSSIPSQESSSWTEGVASEERPQDSSTSESLPDPWPSKSSLSSKPSTCDVQSNVKGTNYSKDCESRDVNAATTVSSFGNIEYLSLPPRPLHEVSNDEKKSESTTPSLPSYLQQDEKNELCLSTIKETDDTGDSDTVWTSQGARPKKTSPLHYDDDYIVSGVDTCFLARHSRDSSLTRSVYSRSQVSAHHCAFLSLPACHGSTEVPLIAKTWPNCEKTRTPYQGLPLHTQRETVRFQDRDIYSCKEQKEVPLPRSHSDVEIGRLPLPGRHSDDPKGTVPLPGSHQDDPTGTVPLPGSHQDDPKGTVPLPGSHLDDPTESVQLPGSHQDDPTDTVQLPGSHLDDPTDITPLPGRHSHAPTDKVPLPGSHQDDPTDKIPLPGRHSDDPTGTVQLPGSHLDDPTDTIPLPGRHSDDPTGRVPLPGSHLDDPIDTILLPGRHSDVTDTAPLPGRHSDVLTGRVPLPGRHSDVLTGRLPLPERHSDDPTGRVPLPERHSDVLTGTVPLPGRHSDDPTGKVPLPGRHSDILSGKVPLPGRHSDILSGTVPLPGRHSDVTDTAPLPGRHSDVLTGRITLPERHSDVLTDTVPLPGRHSDVLTGRITLPGRHSDVPTDTVPLPGRHSYDPTDTVPLPGSHQDDPTDIIPLPGRDSHDPTGRVQLPGSHLDDPIDTIPLPGSHQDDPTDIIPLRGRHSDDPTGTVPLRGRHSYDPTGTVPLRGRHSDDPTGTVPLRGRHSDDPTGTVPLRGRHSDQTPIGRSPSNGLHRHVELHHFSSPHFSSENSLNEIANFSPTQNTNSLSDDDDSYKTADDSFSSLDSLEDQVKRSKMTWSQMSASTMFGPDDDEEEENRSNEMQTENGRERVKNLERTEGRARKTDLEGATSSSPRKDFARREQSDVMTTSQSSAEQATAQRVPANVVDAKESKLRLEMEREREEQRKREEEDIKRRLETSQRAREQSPPSTPQPARLPVQESASEWPCSHYKRKCEIKFPCCEKFYYCHRCHNNSDLCPKDDKKALHGTHLRCLVCLTEQEITEKSQHCIHCKTKLAEYFCGICKHFTGNEKKPYHCEPCGICRIHSDRSFHCNVCNVCLDERLRNNHICRPDSGHDECCICLEDAFGGCQILPCSHKVHRDCAIAMLQNGVRKCPVCRHPLNQSLRR